MNNQKMTAVCTFDDRTQAERAMEDLHRAGFTDDQFGFAMRGGDHDRGYYEHDEGADAGGGVATGAVTGGVVGALTSLMIPGVGPVLAGGILASSIAGAIIGAATGGILGALMDAGVPEDEAKYYESEFQSGRPVLTVRASGRYDEAVAILNRYGRCGMPEGSTGYTSGYARMSEESMTPVNQMQKSGGVGMNKQDWNDVRSEYMGHWQSKYPNT